MWYTLGYANTFICAPAHGGRAGYPRDRSPVLVCLYRPPLPDPPRQCREAANDHDCTLPALHRPNRPQHDSCVPPVRSPRAAASLVTTAHAVDHLRRWGLRGPAGAVAPESADLRPAHEPVDARAGRRSQFCPGPDATTGQRRNHSGGPPPLARVVEAGQTLDHESRSGVCPEKKRRDQLIQRAMVHPSWALGFGDEVWWSRLAQPNQHAWTEADAKYKLQELTLPLDDPDPKALACYGLLVRPEPQQAEQMWLRFVAGRPVSALTIEFLAWCSAQLAAQGFTALLLIWDNASWHRSQAVRHWLRQHNHQVKRGAEGGRIVVCHLPSKSPWLNSIEPKWVHGKRAVSEPDRLLSADELAARVYAYYSCKPEAHLGMPKKVA